MSKTAEPVEPVELVPTAPQSAAVVPHQPTPAELLRIAVNKDADLDKLERLMELQLRWEQQQAHKAYLDAMAAFRAACPVVITKDGHVDHKGGKYDHATLGAAVAAVVPHLTANGLHHSWVPRTNWGAKGCEVEVTCKVSHRLGHTETVTLAGPLESSGSKNIHQQIGSSISYLSRYGLMSILGLAGEDDDGNSTGAGVGATSTAARKQAPAVDPDDLAAAMRDADDEEALRLCWPDVYRLEGERGGPLTELFKRCCRECRARRVKSEARSDAPPPPEPA